MRSLALKLLLLVPALSLAVEVHAGGSIAGVCPDGSAFVVRQKSDIPCARARLVEPSSVPPLRPELLPRPYAWMVDEQARNPNNPYNLLRAAEAVRALHAEEAKKKRLIDGGSAPVETAREPVPASSRFTLAADEIEALVELVDLRQEVAPAMLRAEDALGRGRMEVRFAYSHALESVVLRSLGQDPTQLRVIIFSVRALEAGEFHPNLFFLQDARGFRPEPDNAEELGFLVGGAGLLPPGAIRLGYVMLPGRFQPERPIELWWNDRRVEATLAPERG